MCRGPFSLTRLSQRVSLSQRQTRLHRLWQGALAACDVLRGWGLGGPTPGLVGPRPGLGPTLGATRTGSEVTIGQGLRGGRGSHTGPFAGLGGLGPRLEIRGLGFTIKFTEYVQNTVQRIDESQILCLQVKSLRAIAPSSFSLTQRGQSRATRRVRKGGAQLPPTLSTAANGGGRRSGVSERARKPPDRTLELPLHLVMAC